MPLPKEDRCQHLTHSKSHLLFPTPWLGQCGSKKTSNSLKQDNITREFEIFNIAVRKSPPNINIASILFVWQTVKTTKESWHGQYFQVNYYSNPSLGHTLPAWLKSFTSSYLQGIIVFCMLIISAIVTGLRSVGNLGTSYIFMPI